MNTRNQLIDDLLEQHPNIERSFNLYRRTANIYRRTKTAMGANPEVRFVNASTQTTRVKNDTTESSKIFKCK